MTELLGIEHVALIPDSPTLTLGVSAGQWIGIYGPAGAGKSFLLNVLKGSERPATGTVVRSSEIGIPDSAAAVKKVRPLSLARRSKGPHFASLATEALLATRLWDERNNAASSLTPSQFAAAQLLRPLTESAPLLMLDGELDRTDPWTTRSILDFLRRQKVKGVSMVIVTANLELANEMDAIVVMQRNQVKFAGTPDDLLRRSSRHTFTVSSESQPGVRALVAPFAVSIEQLPDGLRIHAAEGQELAARLLLEGYGNVRALVQRPPTISEAIMGLIK